MKKAQVTRLNILQKAFELIYSKGYQTTSIDDIIATTEVTKGAFYYHFKSKDDMGLAIIEEILKPSLTSSFISALQSKENPIDGIYSLLYNILMNNDYFKVEYGCPVANFASEMTPWNSKFSHVLEELTKEWIEVMINTVEKGKKDGFIRQNVNAKHVSTFIMSGYWGIRNFGKIENDKKAYLPYLEELKIYLNTLS